MTPVEDLATMSHVPTQPTTSPGSLRHRRCVVLFADLVESVRLYMESEEFTIARWRRFAEWGRLQAAPAHDARVVRTDGDGLLLECPDARRAAALAFSLHAYMADEEPLSSSPGATPMALRVGMHLADVAFDEHDAYGAGVNLAHRICSLAQPTQTLATTEASQGLVDGLDADLEDLGERYVKHLSQPVRVFRLNPAGAKARAPSHTERSDLDGRPTLAVVPFTGLHGDPRDQALGFAIADDIIAALARHPSLRVVSRMSTAAFTENTGDWTRLRELLGASFALSGRYTVHGERVRLSLELVDTRDARVLWADVLRADVGALFEGTDELVPMAVREVARHIAAYELARVRSLPMDSLESYSLYLGAEGLMGSLVREDFMRSREVLDHLCERHPRHAAPQALLAKWHVNHIVQAWSSDEPADQRQGIDRVARALDIGGEHPLALAIGGLVALNLQGDATAARRLLTASLSLDPQNPAPWAWLSAVHAYANEASEACDCAARALQMSPLDPERYIFLAYAAMAELAAGRPEAAVVHAQQSLRLNVMHSPSHRLLVGSLGLAGRDADARAAARRWLEVFPAADAGTRTARGLGAQATWRERFSDAVRDAGIATRDNPRRAPTRLS
jgi:TolB-like protein